MFEIELPAVLEEIADINETIHVLNLLKKLNNNPIADIDNVIKDLEAKKKECLDEYEEMMADMVLESESIMEGLEILYE